MKRSSYRDRDHVFGQAMLNLRSAIGLTQTGLADYLGVSRRSVGEWEAGSSYPKAEHLKKLIELGVQQQAFQRGQEAEEIRALWTASHQKVLLRETWLAELLTSKPVETPIAVTAPSPAAYPTQPTRSPQPATSLPLASTVFIGREAELAEIARILSDPACHLLTMLGPGGIGKTRLALEAAVRQTHAFADGAAFVGLASVSTTKQLVSAVGDALNLTFSAQGHHRAELLDYLRERHLLLVLDNFEHLLEGAELVYEILQRAPSVVVLVTSRSRLNLQAEWLFDVGGLVYPASDTPSADLGEYSAVQLFIQRAAQVQSGLMLSDAAALATVARICQQVAGIPLAIELAAAGVRTQPLDEIEQQIRSNLDALSTTLRDVPARHRSIRAVIDHSWDLLIESERILFSRLGVFRGGTTAAAVAHIAGAALPELLGLVDQSLVRQSSPTADDSEAEPRFTMLEPIREYALEKLAARGETEMMQHAHAAYYLSLAEAVAAHWDSPMAAFNIEQLDSEYDNLRAALGWTRDGGDLTIGFNLGSALRKFWRRRGLISEGRIWLADLLARDDDPADADRMLARLRALESAAWLASYEHDFETAGRLFAEGSELRRTLGIAEAETDLLENAARQARAVGHYQGATTLIEDALARYRAIGNRGSLSTGGLGQALYELGLVVREQGDFPRAWTLFEECVELHRTLEDREGVGIGLLGLSDVARDQGDVALMRIYCEESLSILRKLGVQWAIGFVLHNLGFGAYLEGDLAQAQALVSESVGMFRAQRSDASLAEVLTTYGHILRAQGDAQGAYAVLTEALRLAQLVGPRLLVADALEGLAAVLSEQSVLAVRLLSASSKLRVEMHTPGRPANQATVQRVLDAARLRLGADVFESVWSEASQQPFEQIVNLVEATPVSSPPAPVENVIIPPRRLTPSSVKRTDWDEAQTAPNFYGRVSEIKLLTTWVVQERCRIISLLGMGGIGKSSLAVNLMHQLADQFEVVIWRSLRDIPTCDVLVNSLLQVLSPLSLNDVSASLEQRLNVLLEQMQSQQVLLVLDNLESVLTEEENGHLRPGYEGFGRFLRQSAETDHQSCVLLTTREKPNVLAAREDDHVRTLRLEPLDNGACERLLNEKGVIGSPSERQRLIEAYVGNPLALKIVAQTVVDLFDGEITPFLQQGEIIFGGVRELLSEQFTRLSPLAQTVLMWLAVLRETVTFEELVGVFTGFVPRARLLEAVEGLHRRSLVERGQSPGSFTLQSVVLEYVTGRLISEAIEEIQAGRLTRLVEHGLTLAQSREYVRQTQERLILRPILDSLMSIYAEPSAIEGRLLALLSQLSTWSNQAQGYAPANLVGLLRLLRGHLRGLNLSRLMLRNVYLQGVDMQDTTLAGALIQDCDFTETFDGVLALAFSQNGQYWAASTETGEVRLWETGGRRLYRVWQSSVDIIYRIALSPDGRKLAGGTWDGTLKVWDIARGSLLWAVNWPQTVIVIYQLEFSPDGNLIACSGDDFDVRLLKTSDGSEWQRLVHPQRVMIARWTSDGQLLVTGDADGIIRFWKLHKTEPAVCIKTFTGHSQTIFGIAFSPDNLRVASSSLDGTVKVWDVDSGVLIHTIESHDSGVLRLRWSPDGRSIVSSGRDDSIIKLWNPEDGRLQATLQGHTSTVRSLFFTPDNRHLVSSGPDGTLRIWDVATGECLRIIYGYAASLTDLEWSPDSQYVVGGGTDALVMVYSVNEDVKPLVLPGHTSRVSSVTWSPDGRWLASAQQSGDTRIWDVQSGECVQIVRYPDDLTNTFNLIAWSPDGQRLAIGSAQYGIMMWNFKTQQMLRPSEASAALGGNRIIWSPDGTQIAGACTDRQIYIWNTEGEVIQQFAEHDDQINSIDWSTDGRYIVSVTGDELFVWDVQRGERVLQNRGHVTIHTAVVWGTAGMVVTGGNNGKLYWWDVQTGQCLWVRDAHPDTIQNLRSNADRTRLASCGNDGAVTVWDLATGDYVRTVRRDRPYERLNITGIQGLNDAQKATLCDLGAIED